MKAPENKNEILELFKRGPAILENALVGLSDIELDYAPSNGSWSIRQIVHHLVDGDDLWYLALPQTEWAKLWAYDKRSIEVSLTLFKANRDHIIQLLEYSPDGWNNSARFQEPDGKIEVVPAGYVIQMQADHVVHHVKRISAIRQEISGK